MQSSMAISQSIESGVDVHLVDACKTFAGGVKAIDRLSLRVRAGEFVAILGPSGCGKSTLLRVIAGLEKLDTGDLRVAKSEASASSAPSSVAYVFQDAHLLPWRNVIRNVTLPLELAGVNKRDRLEQAAAALEQVGLADALRRYPAQLSGGMRMRVSLARALVTQPKLLLLDEPFAALDEITRQRLDEQLYALWQARRMTTIFVTHSTSEAVYLAQRAVVFSRRPVRTVLDQPIALPDDRPASLRAHPEFAAQTRAIYQALESGETTLRDVKEKEDA